MALETVNGYTLIPHRANWTEEPEWERSWQSEIADGVTGAESRRALRADPRVLMSWTVSPRSLSEHNAFEARLKQALKTGKACAPYWGRGSAVVSDVSGTTATLAAGNAWHFAVGDYVFFLSDISELMDGLAHEVKQLTSAGTPDGWPGPAGMDLGWAGAVARTYPAGSMVWPLVFGKLIGDQVNAVTSRRGEARLTLQELKSRTTVQLGGVIPPAGTGIGAKIIQTNFVVG